jgi:hypothetical protein
MPSQYERGRELGRRAYAEGINAPVLDPAIMQELGKKPGESIPLLRGWLRGWTAANLEAV